MKLLIVDDHALFVEGLKSLLSVHGIEIAGIARNGLEALEQAQALHPDIILMDLCMADHDGFEGISLIKAHLPDTKVAVLTMCEDSAHLVEAIRRGASGYLLKSMNSDEFLELLRSLAQGEVVVSRAMATIIMREFAQQRRSHTVLTSAPDCNALRLTLTQRQTDILQRVALGQTYREISSGLGIGARTVQYHMGEILKKLHLRNRAQVIAFVQRGA